MIPSVETNTIPCFFCGRVEGVGGRLPVLVVTQNEPGSPTYDPRMKAAHMPDDPDDEEDQWCVFPLDESWKQCGACGIALPLHDLVQWSAEMSRPTFKCRRCVEPRRLISGDYKQTTCWCERCTDKAWRKLAPTPRQRLSGTRSAAGSAGATRTADDPATKRLGQIAALLADHPMSTKEIATATGVTERTVRRDVQTLGAVEGRHGKFNKWSMPTEDTDDTGDTP